MNEPVLFDEELDALGLKPPTPGAGGDGEADLGDAAGSQKGTEAGSKVGSEKAGSLRSANAASANAGPGSAKSAATFGKKETSAG